MMITISRDGQQFGPYTLGDARAHLASGALQPTDLAWYEGAPGWVPLPDVPGMSGQPAMAGPHDPLAAANPAVVAAGAAASAAEKGSKKKMIMIVAGSVVGVCAIAAGLWFFVFNKDDGAGGGGDNGAGGGGGEATFGKMVAPIFQNHSCFDCHDSSMTQKIMGGVDFQDPSTVKPLLDDGTLVSVLEDTGDDRMPPEGKGEPLSPADIQKVKDWIAAGGKF